MNDKTDKDIFHALGSDTRLRMLEILGDREIHISKLARELNISVPVASKHIRILEEAGLIERKIFGKSHVLVPNKTNILMAVDTLAPTRSVEVERGATLLEALENVASIEIRKKGDREMIMSTDGDEGFYVYEINGQLGSSSVKKCTLEDDVLVEWKKLEPVTKLKLDVHIKEKNE
jgi:DNA-binding transcriptional ArsR family regulator